MIIVATRIIPAHHLNDRKLSYLILINAYLLRLNSFTIFNSEKYLETVICEMPCKCC